MQAREVGGPGLDEQERLVGSTPGFEGKKSLVQLVTQTFVPPLVTVTAPCWSSSAIECLAGHFLGHGCCMLQGDIIMLPLPPVSPAPLPSSKAPIAGRAVPPPLLSV